MRLLTLFAALGCAGSAFAYPEMVRHEYTTCTTCHVSPSGGGTLTQYGRALSKEVLSGSAVLGDIKDEEKFLYGLVNPPDALLLGGDYRGAYVIRDTPRLSEGGWIQMQGDLSAAARWKGLTLAASAGFTDEDFGSREHYLMYETDPGDKTDAATWRIRGGKFLLPFGIKTPDHSLYIRRNLGINDEDTETYNLEGSRDDGTNQFLVAAVFGRPHDEDEAASEHGASAVASRVFGSTYRVGLSGYAGNVDAQTRVVSGPFVVLGFSPRWYLMAEMDFQWKQGTRGMADWARLGWEFIQGYHLYTQYQQARLDFSETSSLHQAGGIGMQLYPRPHFAIDLQYERKQDLSVGTAFDEVGYVLVHYYL